MTSLVQCKQGLLTLHYTFHGVICHLALNSPKGAKHCKILHQQYTWGVSGFSEMLGVREYTVYVQQSEETMFTSGFTDCLF